MTRVFTFVVAVVLTLVVVVAGYRAVPAAAQDTALTPLAARTSP